MLHYSYQPLTRQQSHNETEYVTVSRYVRNCQCLGHLPDDERANHPPPPLPQTKRLSRRRLDRGYIGPGLLITGSHSPVGRCRTRPCSCSRLLALTPTRSTRETNLRWSVLPPSSWTRARWVIAAPDENVPFLQRRRVGVGYIVHCLVCPRPWC